MAFIEYIPNKDNTSDSANIIRIHQINQFVLKNHLDLYISLMKRAGPISRKLKEMIAVVVSSINKCKY